MVKYRMYVFKYRKETKRIMKTVKKLFSLGLALVLFAGLFANVPAKAGEASLKAPSIKVKSVNNGTAIKVTISKTADADGYEILWMYSDNNPVSKELYKYYGLTTGYGPYVSYDTHGYYTNYMKNKYTEIPYVLKKSGTKARSYTFKNLRPGTYKVKVRCYNNKKYGSKTYSDYCKEKKVKLKGVEEKTGYKTSYDFSNVKKGDVIQFGTYVQDKNYTNGKEPIEWIVLEKKNDRIFVVSKYALDCLPVNKDYKNVTTWKDTTIRKWLNKSFYNFAFNEKEQNMIQQVKLANYDNNYYGTDAGDDTKDKVFLLAQFELTNKKYGFAKDYMAIDFLRKCTYAWETKKKDKEHPTAEGNPAVYWWTRTPGVDSSYILVVNPDGQVDREGIKMDTEDFIAAIRPAMYISLK